MGKGKGRGGFAGIPGGNMQGLMAQAQKMQQQLMDATADLESRVYEGSAGGGVVTCKINGKHQVTELTIKPEAVDPEDVDMLQDMIMAALNDATNKMDADKEETMGRFSIPGLGGMGGLF